KSDGRAPHANTCAGDSGGPLLVKEHGRYELAGVGFWTGLSCEDYAIFSRVDEFLDFFDDMSKLNGNQKVVPRLECVETDSDGKKTARFGYKNDNDLSVYVPYGPRNYFPKDTHNARPTAFQPGDSPYAFKVPFGNNSKLQWTLAPFYGPLTNLTATASSPACEADSQSIICADRCDAEFAAECAQDGLNHGKCVTDCVDEANAFKDYFGCPTEWNAYLSCIADVPAPAANWDCSFPGFPATPKSPNCDQEITDFYVCAGFI
ncbi:MAG TPA: trypsin-like serine protease, partial [Polyangiaceae bacterium]|nr:trypsin-like serine protease [Polyangiaceae bacterium]